MKLEPTTCSMEFDTLTPSGYRFRVTAIKDDEFGWQAHVSISTYGFKDSDGAVKALTHPVKHFLKELESE